jgi:hypothetical protein
MLRLCACAFLFSALFYSLGLDLKKQSSIKTYILIILLPFSFLFPIKSILLYLKIPSFQGFFMQLWIFLLLFISVTKAASRILFCSIYFEKSHGFNRHFSGFLLKNSGPHRCSTTWAMLPAFWYLLFWGRVSLYAQSGLDHDPPIYTSPHI